MNLKVPFVKLTLQHPVEGEAPHVWVNMARCQEMYGHSEMAPYTELVMNIAVSAPGNSWERLVPCVLQVKETPEEIIEMISGNQEKHINGD